MKRIIFLGLMWGLLAGGSGCYGLRQFASCSLGPAAQCDRSHCGPECMGDCGGDCGTVCETAYALACEPACEAVCDPCEPACEPAYRCGPRCSACGPLALVLSLFRCESWCGTGCGEVYWVEFHSDPPDCCDPCDRCGHFTGRQTTDCGCGVPSEAVRIGATPIPAVPRKAVRQ